MLTSNSTSLLSLDSCSSCSFGFVVFAVASLIFMQSLKERQGCAVGIAAFYYPEASYIIKIFHLKDKDGEFPSSKLRSLLLELKSVSTKSVSKSLCVFIKRSGCLFFKILLEYIKKKTLANYSNKLHKRRPEGCSGAEEEYRKMNWALICSY